jgi:glycosyltransferase involved in cell wall biosynthesis
MPGKPISEARRMSQELESVVFVCYNEDGKFLSRKIGSNAYVYTVPLSMKGPLIATLFGLMKSLVTMGSFLTKILDKHRIDFIRADNIVLGGIPTYFVNFLTRTRFAIWLAGSEQTVIEVRYGRGLLPRLVKQIFSLVRRMILNQADFMLSVNASLLCEGNINPKIPCIITPNFVDMEIFSPPAEGRPKFGTVRFLFAGRLESEKGVEILLEALNKLDPNLDYVFHIVGWGSLEHLVQQAQTNNKKIKYLGKYAHEDMPEIFRNADVLVLPSLTEGMPAVVIEAMASGLAIIATRVGRLPEVVNNDHFGKLIPMGDSDKLADVLSEFIHKRKQLSTMGDAARTRVQEVSGGYVDFHRRVYKKFILNSKK